MTSKEFAKLLGISQSTVSRAMNNSSLLSEETKRMVQAKAREVGFVLNTQAQSLKTKRTGTIGVVFPTHFTAMTNNLMLAHIYDKLQALFEDRGYDVLVLYGRGSKTNMSNLERIMRSKKIDGLITFRIGDFSEQEKHLLQQNKIPCVCMLHASRELEPVPAFRSHSYAGGRIWASYISQFPEYKPIHLYVDEEEEAGEVLLRQSGMNSIFESKGITYESFPSKISFNAGYSFIMEHKDMLMNGKHFIMSHTDVLALGMKDAIVTLGIKMPEQIQLIGWDDIPFDTYFHPYLSTLRIPVDEITIDGSKTLIDMINGRSADIESKFYVPKLMVRDTSLPPRNLDGIVTE